MRVLIYSQLLQLPAECNDSSSVVVEIHEYLVGQLSNDFADVSPKDTDKKHRCHTRDACSHLHRSSRHNHLAFLHSAGSYLEAYYFVFNSTS